MSKKAMLGVLALLALMLTACSGASNFKISGEIEGAPNTNLYIKYYGNGALQTAVTAARDGKFEAVGASIEPTIVEILDNEYRVLGRAYVKNGDKLTISVNKANPLLNKITGTETNERWSQVMAQNADVLGSGDTENVNAFIADYITAHPDDAVGTLLFATLYDASSDPIAADNLLSTLTPEARVPSVLSQYVLISQRVSDPLAYTPVEDFKYRGTKSDSAIVFSPRGKAATLIAFSDEFSKRADSIVPRLREIYKAYPAAKFQLMDIALYNDTSSWRHQVQRDSARWIQGWVPGGILGPGLSRLAIPDIPYYIVTDSAGTQVYRGRDPSAADKAIKKLINKKD